MELEFSGELWHWEGPAPWYFVTVPTRPSELLREASKFVTYGWGMIPVRVRIGESEWSTSLFPMDGLYLVPVKASIRKSESLSEGDTVTVGLEIDASRRSRRRAG